MTKRTYKFQDGKIQEVVAGPLSKIANLIEMRVDRHGWCPRCGVLGAVGEDGVMAVHKHSQTGALCTGCGELVYQFVNDPNSWPKKQTNWAHYIPKITAHSRCLKCNKGPGCALTLAALCRDCAMLEENPDKPVYQPLLLEIDKMRQTLIQANKHTPLFERCAEAAVEQYKKTLEVAQKAMSNG